jgi:hypothetical protein
MRIAFLCGGLGLGGVADYTRNLAGALKPQGVESLLIGLADREARDVVRGGFLEAETLILPEALPWARRLAAAEAALASFAPDWVSLQFVPFAFNRKGIVALEGRWLERLLAGRRVQIMMHELWVEPLPRPVPLRRRLLRTAQRAAVLRLLRRVRAELLHTSNPVYLQLLSEAGLQASQLSLFGNVPIIAGAERDWLDAALREAGQDLARGPLLFGFFGGVDPEWDASPFFARLSQALRNIGRAGIVLSTGATPGMPERMEGWRRRHPELGFVALGVQPAERISAYLQALDFGLTSYPYALVGKSSSIMAMLEHELPVILAWGDLIPDLPAVEPQFSSLVLRPGADLERFLSAPPDRRRRGARLPEVAARFLAELDPERALSRGVKAPRLLG